MEYFGKIKMINRPKQNRSKPPRPGPSLTSLALLDQSEYICMWKLIRLKFSIKIV